MTRAAAAAEQRRGVLLGAVAYGTWGMFPLYWPLLSPAGPLEMLAHRMAWSLVVMLGVLWWLGRRRGTGFAGLRAALTSPRQLRLLVLAGLLITANWGAYIWGVTHDRVVETALGYFIGPVVSVLIGVLLLGERLRVAQWIAVGLGTVAVVVLTTGYGELPWIALTLAFAFGLYGLVKKVAAVPAVESIGVESLLLLPPALGYVIVLESTGTGTFASEGVGHALLLAGAGLISTVPLLAFTGAAIRIPLSMIGLLQYIAPVLQFAIGVLVFREHMPVERWIGFAMVWLALLLLTWDGVRRSRA